VATWLVDLPVAVVLLWQLAQVPVTVLWSKRIDVQLLVDVWQLSHWPDVAMCPFVFPVAVVPLWQLEQVPLTPL
jgi:hypothetical protein